MATENRIGPDSGVYPALGTRPPVALALVANCVSRETVEALEELLHAARRGEVIGVAYAAMLKRRDYIVNTAGEAHRHPTFSRGMVAALDEHLSRRVNEQSL